MNRFQNSSSSKEKPGSVSCKTMNFMKSKNNQYVIGG